MEATRRVSVDGIAVDYIEHCWIPMRDGVRISACLWMPADAKAPLPAVLEIIPYRKRDHTAARDFQLHSFLASRGFVSLRADMRGHGDSEGLHDAHRSYADTEEILAWMRAQPWCSGCTGMIGLSWGGTNAFMAANRQPPGLGAIVTCSSSYDRYGVGMLWKNGCMLNENFAWVTSVTAFATRPPDPQVVGEGWRALWQQRLDAHVTEAENMLARQCRDEYWDAHLADPAKITAAALLYSGMADNNYAQTPPTLLPRLGGPAAMVLGAWGHKYPHQAYPGPGVDFLSSAVDWFDQHLRDTPAAAATAAQRPPVCVFMAKDTPAQAQYPSAHGRWVALAALPAADGPQRMFRLDHGRLAESAGSGTVSHCSPVATGMGSGEVMPWFAYGPGPELPDDQRDDDGRSLCFDSLPLAEPLETLGAPELTLDFSVDRPAAFIAVRLCDVKPSGASTRVSLGLFNLNNLLGEERAPRMLEPGKRYRLTLPMDFGAYRFLAGHRVRLAISTSYWPLVWPSPEPVTITVDLAGSALRLPVHDRAREVPPPDFGKPRFGAALARSESRPPAVNREVRRNVAAGTTEVLIEERNGPYRLEDIDWTVASQSTERYTIAHADPASAAVDIDWEWQYGRAKWSATTRVRSSMRCSTTQFHIRLSLEALENGQPFLQREWSYDFPRNHL